MHAIKLSVTCMPLVNICNTLSLQIESVLIKPYESGVHNTYSYLALMTSEYSGFIQIISLSITL